jgi:hypothetical protein
MNISWVFIYNCALKKLEKCLKMLSNLTVKEETTETTKTNHSESPRFSGGEPARRVLGGNLLFKLRSHPTASA